MEWSDLVKLISEILWGSLSIIIAFAIKIYIKRDGNLKLLQSIALKAKSLVDWADAQYPDLEWLDKVDAVVEAIVEELEKEGYKNVDETAVNKQVVAAFQAKAANAPVTAMIQESINTDL
jgi:DNA-directed RNA polymerase specialized sigma54-like protein